MTRDPGWNPQVGDVLTRNTDEVYRFEVIQVIMTEDSAIIRYIINGKEKTCELESWRWFWSRTSAPG